jgi:hypothetical protein
MLDAELIFDDILPLVHVTADEVDGVDAGRQGSVETDQQVHPFGRPEVQETVVVDGLVEESSISTDDGEGKEVLVVVELVGGVGRVDLLIDCLTTLLTGGIVGSKDHVVESIIEGGVENTEAVSRTSLKLRLFARESVGIGGDSGPGVALLAKDNESFIAAAGQDRLYLRIIDDPQSSQSVLHVVEG